MLTVASVQPLAIALDEVHEIAQKFSEFARKFSEFADNAHESENDNDFFNPLVKNSGGVEPQQ